ncbi:uncharacterized protein E0L32_007391 [Thyridium curvatum]|uniref:F-box domain-containing protein n=1 Tax=Thyridium curvatum TaxID=1093900 RepID=A0A507AVZ4_9PEZI|nr:uncharacterized protein E0L32_007391 [Thyridium curvatum]TPX11893.1 hypothetical protein E0L32_007391 [Thyridium curvatum]
MSSYTPAAMPATPNKPIKEEENPSPAQAAQAATASPLVPPPSLPLADPKTPSHDNNNNNNSPVAPITLDNYYQRSSLTDSSLPNRVIYVSLHPDHPAFEPPAHGRSFLDRLPAEIMLNITSRLSLVSRDRLRQASPAFEPYTRPADADLDRKLDYYHSVDLARWREDVAAAGSAGGAGAGAAGAAGAADANADTYRHMCYRCFELLPAADFSKAALGRPPRHGGSGPRRRREREDCRRQFCRACGKQAQREGSRRAAAARKVSKAAARAEKERVEDLASLIGDSPGKECVVLPGSPAAAGAAGGAGANDVGNNNNGGLGRKARHRRHYEREELAKGTYGSWGVNRNEVDW